jgi:hypothetical protein
MAILQTRRRSRLAGESQKLAAMDAGQSAHDPHAMALVGRLFPAIPG